MSVTDINQHSYKQIHLRLTDIISVDVWYEAGTFGYILIFQQRTDNARHHDKTQEIHDLQSLQL